MSSTSLLPALFTVLHLSASGWAAEVAPHSMPQPLAECATGKDGRLVEVPVRIGTHAFNFLLDTGSSLTCFGTDLAKLVGPSTGQEVVLTHGGKLLVEKYRCPPATWIGLNLQQHASVFTTDLTPLRQASGRPIDGIIGMDVLRHYVIRIDFDAGRLQVFPPVAVPPESWGERVALSAGPGDLPLVKLRLGGSVSDLCLIDTGANVSTLNPSVCEDLNAGGHFQFFRQNTWISSASGMARSRSGRLSDLMLASHTARSLRFDISDCNSLGLNALSRFRLTLDFPGRAIHIAPGRRSNEADQPATSGLAIIWVNSQLTVFSVQPGSAAEVAGFKSGDIVLQIESFDTEGLDYLQVSRLLTSQPGRRLKLVVQRDDQQHAFSLVLAERQIAP
jgi:hypothetical protein